MNRTPCQSSPRGKNQSAPTLSPSVPTSVTTSGLMPSRMKRLTKGARALPCQNALNLSSTGAGYPPAGPASHTGPVNRR